LNLIGGSQKLLSNNFSYYTIMLKRIAPFLLSLFLGLGLLGWWVSQWAPPIPVQETAKDNLWRSVTKTGK
jgi:hypothetical protein